MNIYRV